MSPLLVNTGNPVTVTVPGFDRPVYGSLAADGSTAYILNCGAAVRRHAGQRADSEPDDHAADCRSVGSGERRNHWLSERLNALRGRNGTPSGPRANNPCTGQTTAATYLRTLDIVDLNGAMTVHTAATCHHRRLP